MGFNGNIKEAKYLWNAINGNRDAKQVLKCKNCNTKPKLKSYNNGEYKIHDDTEELESLEVWDKK
jgi:hypothetical protein